MAKVVNLRRVRKSRARDEKRAESAARTGEGDAKSLTARLERAREDTRHDAKKLDRET